MNKEIYAYAIVFLIGFLSCTVLGLIYEEIEQPLRIGSLSLIDGELEAPGNWISEEDIHIYENAIVIDIEDASLSRYAPTGSMKPLLDKDSNGIRVVPENPDQVVVGDIITFEDQGDLIVHRVIEKGTDQEGTYFITKGDNNNITDGKVRFENIRYVTIAIIW